MGADFAGPDGGSTLLFRTAGSGGAAPLRLTFVGRTAAPPARIHHALAEDVTGWPRWFRAVTLARPLGGTGRRRREIRLVGGARFDETVMASDAPRRFAYRVDSTNVPFLRAVLEDWRLAPAGPSGGGTLVRWTVALDAPLPVRCLALLARPALAHSFRGAVRALDARLAGAGAGDTGGCAGGGSRSGGRGGSGDGERTGGG
ncbi:SRPBCC family protein [Streptomyces huiliensis]|uniref:SRPBCC family protein n=1 Tax=Streptomyces huiliensis TaxID=2876027 RepID=UPI0035582B32